jgi:hypothetical protein
LLLYAGENPNSLRFNSILTSEPLGGINTCVGVCEADDISTQSTDDAVDNDTDGIVGDTFGEGHSMLLLAR